VSEKFKLFSSWSSHVELKLNVTVTWKDKGSNSKEPVSIHSDFDWSSRSIAFLGFVIVIIVVTPEGVDLIRPVTESVGG
jgi:hypothetical protein